VLDVDLLAAQAGRVLQQQLALLLQQLGAVILLICCCTGLVAGAESDRFGLSAG
jgi:hypothetical protein